VIATENKRKRNIEIAIPPKIKMPFPIGLAVVAKTDIQRKATINKAMKPHIHTFLGMVGKNIAHLFDR
jgi:hypothetical protein